VGLKNNNNNNNQYQTHMLSLTLATQQLNQVQQPKNSAEQDRQILQIGQYTHLLPICHKKTAGTWHGMAIELTQEIGRPITTITEDTRETTFLFQRISTALQTGNAVSFHNTIVTE